MLSLGGNTKDIMRIINYYNIRLLRQSRTILPWEEDYS